MKNVLAITLKGQKAKVAYQTAKRDAEIAALKDQATQRSAGITELQDQMAQRYAEIAELREQMAQRNAEIAELREHAAQRDAETTELKDQILKMKNANEERLLKMEMALAELLPNQLSEDQVDSTH